MASLTTLHWVELALMAFGPHALVAVWTLSGSGKRQPLIFAVTSHKPRMHHELLHSLITPVHAALFFIFVASGLLRCGDESLTREVMTLAATFAVAETWHYATHYAMHHSKLMRIHKAHHESRVATPLSSLSFDFGEKALFSTGIIGVMAAVSHLTPVSFQGIVLYYLLYFVGNVIGHSNRERGARPSRIFTSATYHALHHARGQGNFGHMTRFLDRWLGTEFVDYELVFARVRQGQPLKSLRERVEP